MTHLERQWIIPTRLFDDPPALRSMLEAIAVELQGEARDEGLLLDATTLRRRLLLPLPDTDVPTPAGDVFAALGVTVTRPEHELEHAIPTAALLTTAAQASPPPAGAMIAGDPSTSGG